MLDYAALSREFLRSIRGRRSQTALSRRLGYRTNAVYTWESGRRAPTAATVLRCLGALRLDVRGALGRFFVTAPAWLEPIDPASPEGVAALLRELRGSTPVAELARRSGFSRYALMRWFEGRAEPRLPDFFRLLESLSLRLLDFIALFVEPERLPSAASEWRRLEAHRRSAYDQPFAPAVLRAIELADYQRLGRHQPGWIAKRLGIGLDTEQACLRVLEQSGQIRREGERLEPTPALAVDTRSDPEAERRLKLSFARIGMERLESGAPGSFSFNVFGVSRRDFERLRELHRNYFRHLRALVASSSPSECVAVANVQLFALDPEALLAAR